MAQLKNFPLPDVGEGLTEAEILNWRIQPGDAVELNQIIVEIETAKASVELPCPYAGTINELLAEPGQTVEVGTPILTIEPAGASGDDAESTDQGDAEADTGRADSAEQGGKIGEEGADGRIATLVGYGPRSTSAKRRPRKNGATSGSGGGATGSGGRPPATNGTPVTAPASSGGAPVNGSAPRAAEQARPAPAPASGTDRASGDRVPLAKPPVRKLAKDLGVDLRSLPGSGSGGVITREDVERAASGGGAATTPTTTGATGTAATTAQDRSEREQRVPIKGVRKATAQAMVDSAFTAPHVTEFLTIDVTPMMEFRERLKKHPEFRDVKVTPLAIASKAMCLAAKRTPDVNASWDGESGEIVYKDYVHLGVAAATERGLVVPKVRDADGMSLRELAVALEELTSTAREGRTPPEAMTNGTITITNVGVFGVDTGTPILNPGESAILAFGAIREMPWVVDGQVVPRQVCQLALSFDHRVVDGQQGSRFLADVGAILSDPGMALTFQ
ncbi:branched-chain alpha-keto acid dehydrogenase subunit E2 [Actinopolyspora erythraea]|uniref:Dihydrolipoamide acetyltransferase component of pyruvate dehydrogenase complex n=1 Tax=Actinopolyspora erythraea TaxID=414996 RepID=A0A099DBK6_9ACTN|nr:dihydrolipoamide acetyltransferase family protein [Actinopolyspora erythraea]ASU80534.1 branched-chain alpha-keto acid dehydrogenase subunit E2 [Actinopolyspora erythraea]KGI82795.1 branched-chain alpha-keto acid dehydrogenase subunit E2 [Actinopolyspora erythraea]